MLDALKDAVGNAVGDAAMNTALKYAESKIKEYTGRDIEVDTAGDMDDSDKEWIRKTAVNSLCVEDTWDFLEKSEANARKVELWNKRNIKKIVMKINKKPDPEKDADWWPCTIDYKESDNFFTITWLPYGLSWSSSNHYWESGYRCWWILRDQIVYSLQLYQLPGKCFYKSDWLDGVEDPDPNSFMPTATKKFKRWFQFRHWCIYWYATGQWGYNYQWTDNPPKNPDGSDFNLSDCLKLPGMPNLKMPDIRLPQLSLPGMPSLSMPSMSMPSVSMPSMSMPSMSMPSMSMPSLGSLPGIPEKKKRPKGTWDCHGIIELEGMKAIAKGNKLILSNATITHIWENKDGSYDNERKEHQRLVLECTDNEQAQSWVLSLKEGGVEEGELGGGCCNVA
jgi:hypothetical protein